MEKKEVMQNFEVKLNYQQYDRSFNIVLVGDKKVGKSTIIDTLLGNDINKGYETTKYGNIFNVYTKINDKTFRLCGNETTREEGVSEKDLNHNIWKKCSLVILVYDITSRETYENIESWLEELKAFAKEAEIIIVANKSDLDKNRKVSKEEAEKKEYDSRVKKLMECSAISKEDVKKLFYEVSEILYQKDISDDEKINAEFQEQKKVIAELKKENNVENNREKKCC